MTTNLNFYDMTANSSEDLETESFQFPISNLLCNTMKPRLLNKKNKEKDFIPNCDVNNLEIAVGFF